MTPDMRYAEDSANYLNEQAGKQKESAMATGKALEEILSQGKEVDGKVLLPPESYAQAQKLQADLKFNVNAYDKLAESIKAEEQKLGTMAEGQKEEQGFFERKAKMAGTSGTGLLKSVGDGLRMLGIEETGKNISQSIQAFEDNYLHVYDPGFLDQLAQGVASTATFFIPGFGVAKIAKVLNATPKVAALLGQTAASVLESFQNAGDVYSQNLAKGLTASEATNKATTTFLLNIPLNAFLNGWAFRDVAGQGKLRTLAKGILEEATQEGSQQVISQEMTSTKRDLKYLQDIGLSALIGGIVGGGGSALRVGSETLKESRENKQLEGLRTEQVAKEYELDKKTIEQLRTLGYIH